MTMDRLSDVLAGIREETLRKLGPGALDSGSETPSPEEPTCQTCRGAGFLRFDVAVDHPSFGKISPCPDCGDERERARLARVAERISAECGLEAKQRGMTFENFEKYPGNTKAFDASARFAEKGIDAGAWLIIRGKEMGTGKTHLLAAIANVAIPRGIPTIYAYVPELLDHLRAGYKKQDDGKEELGDFADRWERVKAVKVLLLDDLGVQVNSPWVREHIDSLIDARYRAGLPTAITTNLSDVDLSKMCPRAFDRLDRHEPAAMVEMLAIKYRTWKQQQTARGIPF